MNYCKHKADQTISEKGGKDGPSTTHLIHRQEHGIHLNRHTTIVNMHIQGVSTHHPRTRFSRLQNGLVHNQ